MLDVDLDVIAVASDAEAGALDRDAQRASEDLDAIDFDEYYPALKDHYSTQLA